MPRTIRLKVYKFRELSEKAKDKAIEEYRANGSVDTQHIYDDAYESVKAFNDVFGTEEGSKSWLDVRTSHIDDNIMNLKGLRLRTYIINNFYDTIHKGEFLNSWTTDKPVRHRKVKTQLISKENGWHNTDIMGKYYNTYYSLKKESSCPFTGVCYDSILLQPVIEFIEWKSRPDYNSYMDFETLMNDCLESLQKALEEEEQYQYSDEAITETIEANEYEFTKDGRMYP